MTNDETKYVEIKTQQHTPTVFPG